MRRKLLCCFCPKTLFDMALLYLAMLLMQIVLARHLAQPAPSEQFRRAADAAPFPFARDGPLSPFCNPL